MAQPIGHLERVRALASAARTCWVAGVRADKTSQITAFDHVAEKPDYVIEVEAHVLALVAEADTLVAACSDGVVRMYAPKDGKPIREIKAHEGACNAIAVRKGGTADLLRRIDKIAMQTPAPFPSSRTGPKRSC